MRKTSIRPFGIPVLWGSRGQNRECSSASPKRPSVEIGYSILDERVDSMRMKKTRLRNQGRRIAIGTAVLGLTLFGLATVQHFLLDGPRLLSIQQMSEMGESCNYTSTQTTPEE